MGRGAATTFQEDLQYSDCILIMGSNMAEAHPVGFRFPMTARENGWQERDERGWKVDRTLGFAHLGGATLDNEENYLIKKLFTSLGVVGVENQARI